jgi:Tfp pilus assembly protein PilO
MTEQQTAPAVRNQALVDTAIAQRDAAMNQVCELTADLAVARARIAELEQAAGQLAALEARITELEQQLPQAEA